MCIRDRLYTAITSGTVVGLTIAANTTDQTVDISVGGAAATTVNWTVVARWQRRDVYKRQTHNLPRMYRSRKIYKRSSRRYEKKHDNITIQSSS